MTFKEAMEHYRQGNANEEERLLVEQELEKSRLIAEYLDEQWEDAVPIPAAPAEEMQQVRKSLRKRNAWLVLTSLVLVAALTLATVFIGIPAAESMYWDPTLANYDPNATDLELMLAAYTELFCPDINLSHVTAEKIGFAKYALYIRYWNTYRGGDTYLTTGAIVKDDMSLLTGFLEYCPVNIFERATYPFYPAQENHLETVYEKLSQLPEYVTVVAAVSFPEDKNMAEVLTFSEGLIDGQVNWAAIRTAPLDEQVFPLFGMNIYSWGSVRDSLNDAYPCFDLKGVEKTSENLQTHFKSLLQFSADQTESGTGIPAGRALDKSDYYTAALDYVEANGIYSYGCFVTGTPETFLELIESGAVTQVWITDIFFRY